MSHVRKSLITNVCVASPVVSGILSMCVCLLLGQQFFFLCSSRQTELRGHSQFRAVTVCLLCPWPHFILSNNQIHKLQGHQDCWLSRSLGSDLPVCFRLMKALLLSISVPSWLYKQHSQCGAKYAKRVGRWVLDSSHAPNWLGVTVLENNTAEFFVLNFALVLCFSLFLLFHIFSVFTVCGGLQCVNSAVSVLILHSGNNTTSASKSEMVMKLLQPLAFCPFTRNWLLTES